MKFTLGDFAATVAGLDDRSYPENPLLRCQRVRRFGRHTTQYEAPETVVHEVLRAIESCPAFVPRGALRGEGFGGEYTEVQAIRNAADSLRKRLGLSQEYRRSRRKQRPPNPPNPRVEVCRKCGNFVRTLGQPCEFDGATCRA